MIYPTKGYHTEDVAEGAKIERKNIKVVALADLFDDRIEQCRVQLAKLGIDIPQDRCFAGFDAYKQLLAEPSINYIIQATPPHFRPEHLLAAIEAGKHVFIEKPAAVDVPGVKTVMEAGRLVIKSTSSCRQLGMAISTLSRAVIEVLRPRTASASWGGGGALVVSVNEQHRVIVDLVVG